jgi:hypothetical protein
MNGFTIGDGHDWSVADDDDGGAGAVVMAWEQ